MMKRLCFFPVFSLLLLCASACTNDPLAGNGPAPEAKAVASLLRSIGDIVRTNYTPGGSSAYSKNAATFMSQWLLYRNVALVPFSAKPIYEMLRKRLPVYIAGWYRPNPSYNKRNGHAWVIDGWSRQQRTGRIYSLGTNAFLRVEVEYRELFHCNFGWRGVCDGYYFPGVFDIFKGVGLVYKDDLVGDRGITRDDLYNLNSDLEMITYSPF